MVALIITVLLVTIITSMLAKNSYTNLNLKKLTRLENDIDMLNDRIAVYFVGKEEIPKYGDVLDKESIVSIMGNELNPNDGDNYYVIDLAELDTLSLNYGKDYQSSWDDKYIINEETHQVYYLKGITYDGRIYYTIGGKGLINE